MDSEVTQEGAAGRGGREVGQAVWTPVGHMSGVEIVEGAPCAGHAHISTFEDGAGRWHEEEMAELYRCGRYHERCVVRARVRACWQ